MGRGDKKTKQGKVAIGSFGVSRNKKKIKARINKKHGNTGAVEGVVVSPEEKAKARRSKKKKTEA